MSLNVAAFPSLRVLQAEIIEMVSGLLHGGPGAAGSITSGGTESLLLAVKAARGWGRAERGIERPQMVLPTSAHAAFEKAARDYGVESVRVAVREDFRADPAAIAAAIPAVLAFAEQNWLELYDRPHTQRHFVDCLAQLRARRLIDDAGHPQWTR